MPELLKRLGQDVIWENLDPTLRSQIAPMMQQLLDRAQKEGRPDDTEPVIKSRLKTYEEQTLPLVEYYKKEGILKEVDGLGSLEEITARIKSALGL